MLTLDAARNTATNSDYIPFAADIEADIRLTQRAMREIDDEGVSGQTLKGWLDAFSHLAAKYINRAGALCGIFLENAAVEGGKEFGKTVVKVGGIAASLYFAGIDFHGIAVAIGAFLTLKQSAH
ncbi:MULTISPECIES: hypothetical protein [Agrobacterium]|uniref:hypothetical protein n=1 Tax=Agrobacterium TaxID=357 RepID=UPI00157487C1|nr:hypothetical protein [Agrobacterium tumefaciens]NTA51284.1 hypothetical protein [Agrobacterium tumefaciens]